MYNTLHSNFLAVEVPRKALCLLCKWMNYGRNPWLKMKFLKKNWYAILASLDRLQKISFWNKMEVSLAKKLPFLAKLFLH